MYDDYDGDSSAIEEKVVTLQRPKFITSPLTLMVNEGEMIR